MVEALQVCTCGKELVASTGQNKRTITAVGIQLCDDFLQQLQTFRRPRMRRWIIKGKHTDVVMVLED